MKINKKLLLVSTLLLSFSSVALESDYEQAIHVSSLTQHAKMKENTVVFSQQVLLTQGSIKISADKLTVIRDPKTNHEIMIADGNLATFYQTQDDGKPLNAQAKSIRYDVGKGKITLSGNAQVKQLDSQINGSEIVYSLTSEELTVNTGSGENERVSTVFLPAQFEKDKKDATESTTSEKEE